MKYVAIVMAAFLIYPFTVLSASAQRTKPPLVVGVDANYAEGMEREMGLHWQWDRERRDLFQEMNTRGVDAFRTRLWVGDHGPHGTLAASRVIARAANLGIDPYVVLFLSDGWADLMKQPVPAIWKELSFEQKLSAVQDYSRDVVSRLRQDGLTSHLYEIGNEIDYGICGEYPGKSGKKDPASLCKRIWPRSAKLILASQAGVREADPEAKFMLHIAHWWDIEFCKAFFEFMIGQGVQVDYAGLSYFPSANIGGSLEMREFAETASLLAHAIDRPIVVPETAYPCTRDFKGQFSRWKYEAPGYPLTLEGQRQWISDFLAMCEAHPDIHAVYYWSPEWFGEGMWKGFALFEPDGDSRPAWDAFDRSDPSIVSLPQEVILEVRDNQIFRVPVEDARHAMEKKIASLRHETSGVSVEHIALLSSTELIVDDYSVELRASLQNNMHLFLLPSAKGLSLDFNADEMAHGFDKLISVAAPQTHRIVLFFRDDSSELVGGIADHLRSRGFHVYPHPLKRDAPLKFGMSGRFDLRTVKSTD